MIIALAAAVRFRRFHRAYTKALDGLPPARWPAAIKAIERGPVPTDPSVRDVAIRLAKVMIGVMAPAIRGWRVWLVLGLLFVSGAVYQATTGSPRDAAFNALVAALLVYNPVSAFYTRRRLERRVATLSGGFGDAVSSESSGVAAAGPSDGRLATR